MAFDALWSWTVQSPWSFGEDVTLEDVVARVEADPTLSIAPVVAEALPDEVTLDEGDAVVDPAPTPEPEPAVDPTPVVVDAAPTPDVATESDASASVDPAPADSPPAP